MKEEIGFPDTHSKMGNEWPFPAKILHVFLVAGVTFQLITGLMGWCTGRIPFFTWHTLVGRMLILVIFLQWLWLFCFAQGRSVLMYLFPVSLSGLKSVLQDVKELMHYKLADPGPRAGLPGLMHGIFLLSATLVAAAGLVLFGTFHGWWTGLPIGLLLQILRWGAVALALQWIGHVGMASLHALIGEPLWRIFNLIHCRQKKS